VRRGIAPPRGVQTLAQSQRRGEPRAVIMEGRQKLTAVLARVDAHGVEMGELPTQVGRAHLGERLDLLGIVSRTVHAALFRSL
jgi:hypothetical protein